MTFYISSSAKNISRVQDLASKLPGVWHFNWVENVLSGGKNADAAKLDLEAARDCDLFVFLDSPHHTKGGMMEYGVRLISGGVVHHIGCVEDYLFFKNSVHHADIDSFLESI